MNEKITAHNRRLAKKRVQCLNEALSFVSSSVLADSLVLRNPLLRQAPNRYASPYKRPTVLTSNDRKMNKKPTLQKNKRGATQHTSRDTVAPHLFFPTAQKPTTNE